MSLPKVRAMETRRDNPSLASQAPNVKRTIKRWVLNWDEAPKVKMIKMVSVKIMASRDRSDISKCFRCITKVIIAAKTEIESIMEISIAERGVLSFWFTRPALLFSFFCK